MLLQKDAVIDLVQQAQHQILPFLLLSVLTLNTILH